MVAKNVLIRILLYFCVSDNHFNASNNGDWGWSRFLSLAELKDPKNGFVVNDTLIIEAEVTLLGLVVVES